MKKSGKWMALVVLVGMAPKAWPEDVTLTTDSPRPEASRGASGVLRA